MQVHQSCLRYLESGEEGEVLSDCESVKENVVLGTDAEGVADLVHVLQNAEPVDHRIPRRGCVQAWVRDAS